jgi:hypothetical protein
MFREGDPEVTLAHWAIILDYADAVYARAAAEVFKRYRNAAPRAALPKLIYGPRDPIRAPAAEGANPQRKAGESGVIAFQFDGLFSKDVKP